MKPLQKYIDMFKIRASWGVIGDDNVGGRWLYKDTYAYGGNTTIGSPLSNSPYTIYRQSQLGNANVRWETVEKRNLGFDFAFLNGLVAGSFDVFADRRKDILIGGGLTRYTNLFRYHCSYRQPRTCTQSWLGIVTQRKQAMESQSEDMGKLQYDTCC